jgi:hypothetical protein
MSGVFQNIDSPPPSPPGECVPPPPARRHTRWVERGWGVNILEDARHGSVLYICKYFVGDNLLKGEGGREAESCHRKTTRFSKNKKK